MTQPSLDKNKDKRIGSDNRMLNMSVLREAEENSSDGSTKDQKENGPRRSNSQKNIKEPNNIKIEKLETKTRIEEETKTIKEEESDKSLDYKTNSLTDELGESDEDESESYATKSNFTKSSKAVSSNKGGKIKGIGVFQQTHKKFTGSSLGFNRKGDPSVLAWASRVESSRLGQSSLGNIGLDNNVDKTEILKLIEVKLENQKIKLDKAHNIDIKNIKKVVTHESIDFLKRNCHNVERVLTTEH